ncbi:hotdog fold thioesterase [Aureispira anguillae]|uniref:Hotdog fold thioesterase n=1 Tax=Aureispira anguillae TaxID=2864201 RepID=A0A916DPW0_9BACT|nr:hotdog fold thioesterase [Aureispira anguillae]BDS10794.1 hotdog fold thioesterase [Aureispira anguillae]
MKIWKQEFTLEGLDSMSVNTLVETFDIKFVAFGDDYLVAEMPVTHKNVQPMRILHGGASVALAETVGSIASVLCLDDPMTNHAVGLDINANHLRSVPEGDKVRAKVSPIHLGKKTHIWQIDITNEAGKLTCVSRLTMMIRKARL